MSIGDRLKQWWEKIRSWFGHDPVTPPVIPPVVPPVIPPVTPPVAGSEIRAHFLKGWNGGRCSLFWLSTMTSDTEFNEELAAHIAAGYNAVFAYLLNAGDGDRKHPVDVPHNLAFADARIKRIVAAGLQFIPILVADDSSAFTGKGPSYLLVEFDNCKTLWPYWDIVIDGIELAESWKSDKGRINVLGQGLKSRGFKVGHHTLPIHGTNYENCNQPWCDYAMLQLNSPFSRLKEATAKQMIVAAQNALTARVVAFEQDVQLDGSKLGAEGGWACGRGK